MSQLNGYLISRAEPFLKEYFTLCSFVSYTVPPGLPRLSEDRNVVNARQGTEQVIPAIPGHYTNYCTCVP